jgi:hypothetical protein
MATDFIRTDKFSELEIAAMAVSPTVTRLEPQSTTGDPGPGVEARVHDPLWLMGRQWQLGEFEGEDAGTPLTVRIVTRTVAVDRWGAGAKGSSTAFARDRHEVLEPLVEAEAVMVIAVGLRARAEAAAALLAALDDAELGPRRDDFIQACRLDVRPAAGPDSAQAQRDPAWARLVRLLRGRPMADAESICRAFEAAAGALPPWLVADPEETALLLAVVQPWIDWYRAEVSPLPTAHDAWNGERLEYQFRMAAGDTVLEAPAHDGGDIDWTTFDAARPAATLAEPVGAQPAPAADRQVHALLATPLRYPGMPADRLWEMEDAQINLGLVEAEPWDLARLLVAEFALTYGNDWFVVPLDVPFGSLTTIESLTYATTFGEHFVVKPTASVSPDHRWQMYTITGADGVALNGLLVPPSAVAVQDGPAIEEVLFIRDEMANMAWAVERKVQGASGSARDRARERDTPKPQLPGQVSTADLDYQLQTSVPGRWIPYLPRATRYRAIDLVQGRIPAAVGPFPVPLGVLLNRDDLKVIKDAEVPREGLLVRRQRSVTRLPDGRYICWTTRRTSVGRGDGASGLAYDNAHSRKRR